MAVFSSECILKLMALQKGYFQSGWNIFDMVIVVVSYLDLAVADTGGSSRGLSVIRSMRLVIIKRYKWGCNNASSIKTRLYLFTAPGLQTGPKLGDNESSTKHNLFVVWSPGESDMCAPYCHLHFCCDGDAGFGGTLHI